MNESSSSSQSGAQCVEQSSSSTGAASKETVELKGRDGADANSHFSIRSRSVSTSSLFETEEPHCKVVSTVSMRSGKSSCLSENGDWHPGWVSVSDLSSASLSVTRRGHPTDFGKFDSDGDTTNGGEPVWIDLDGTDGLSLSTYSSSSPPRDNSHDRRRESAFVRTCPRGLASSWTLNAPFEVAERGSRSPTCGNLNCPLPVPP